MCRGRTTRPYRVGRDRTQCRIGKHTHFGIDSGVLQVGDIVLNAEGRPEQIVKPGDSWQIPPNTVHWGKVGPNGAKIINTYVVEKGKPLATPVQQQPGACGMHAFPGRSDVSSGSWEGSAGPGRRIGHPRGVQNSVRAKRMCWKRRTEEKVPEETRADVRLSGASRPDFLIASPSFVRRPLNSTTHDARRQGYVISPST